MMDSKLIELIKYNLQNIFNFKTRQEISIFQLNKNIYFYSKYRVNLLLSVNLSLSYSCK